MVENGAVGLVGTWVGGSAGSDIISDISDEYDISTRFFIKLLKKMKRALNRHSLTPRQLNRRVLPEPYKIIIIVSRTDLHVIAIVSLGKILNPRLPLKEKQCCP